MAARHSQGPGLDDIVGFFSGGGLEGLDHDRHLCRWERRSTDPDT